MKQLIFFALALIFIIGCKSKEEDPMTPTDTGYEGYTLVWADEFDDPAISNLNWVYETGDGTDYDLPPGWGNDELQIYTNSADNSYIEKDANDVSALVIEAREDTPGNYTSAKLTTNGLRSFRYGRIEARIKLPTAQGMWPAFWMLGTNRGQVDWPGCGEIDIVELVGSEPDVIHGSVHYTTADNTLNSIIASETKSSGTFEGAYHDFRVDWTPESIEFSLDGIPYTTVTIEDDMKEFQRSFYLILNIAVGGNWPGDPDATTTFPQKMYVDYIRVYSQDGFTPPAEPALDIDEETIGMIIPPNQAQHALNSQLAQFADIELKSFGPASPIVLSTDAVVEGDSALIFSYPGDNWGGGWFELSTPQDLTALSTGNLKFSIRQPADLKDAEIKLEAVSNSAAVYIVDYTPTPVANGYVEYTIPLTDFVGLDFSAIKIPFALWNPVDDNGDYPVLEVYLDNIYWE